MARLTPPQRPDPAPANPRHGVTGPVTVSAASGQNFRLVNCEDPRIAEEICVLVILVVGSGRRMFLVFLGRRRGAADWCAGGWESACRVNVRSWREAEISIVKRLSDGSGSVIISGYGRHLTGGSGRLWAGSGHLARTIKVSSIDRLVGRTVPHRQALPAQLLLGLVGTDYAPLCITRS